MCVRSFSITLFPVESNVTFTYTGCKEKNGPPPRQFYPFLDGFPTQFFKFLTEQVKSKFNRVKWEHTVIAKI